VGGPPSVGAWEVAREGSGIVYQVNVSAAAAAATAAAAVTTVQVNKAAAAASVLYARGAGRVGCLLTFFPFSS
jgi:hypothetical protein